MPKKRLQVFKVRWISCFALLLPLCCPLYAQEPFVTLLRPNYGVQARAYVVKGDTRSSRYDIRLMSNLRSTDKWDFTLDSDGADPFWHYTNLNGVISPTPYGNDKTTTLKVTLWKYDAIEERVTFHDLDLVPLANEKDPMNSATPRFLSLKSPITVTTPSGIQITFLAQNVQRFEDMFPVFDGNPDALFIRVRTTPDQPESILRLSPLYQKYLKPVSIKLDCDKPNSMVFYQADNTYKIIAVYLPNLKTATHLDSLTLIIRQRVDIERIPVTLNLPIDRG